MSLHQTPEERKAWLSSLKLNDKVALWSTQYGKDFFSILTVEDITPTRKKFYLAQRNQTALVEVDADGKRKRSDKYSVADVIIPLSDCVKSRIMHQNAAWKLEKLLEAKKVLTTDQMTRIIAILEEK